MLADFSKKKFVEIVKTILFNITKLYLYLIRKWDWENQKRERRIKAEHSNMNENVLFYSAVGLTIKQRT